MYKLKFILAIFLGCSLFSKGQSSDIFNIKLYAERLTQSELVSKYLSKVDNYEYYKFDTAFYSLSFKGIYANIPGKYSLAMKNDSLCQIYFASYFPISEHWLKSLHKQTDSLIAVFTNIFGQPSKSIDNFQNYSTSKEKSSNTICKSMWAINGEKLKIEFSIEEEHGKSAYLVRIVKFKDYYGNTKLTQTWDGY